MPKTISNSMFYILILIALPIIHGDGVEEYNGCSIHKGLDCDPYATCIDNFEDLTWTCVCPENMAGNGFKLGQNNGTGCGKKKCQLTTDCGYQAICNVNAECECNPGFHDNSGNCTDTNECAGEHPCHKHAICHNTEGSFKCACDEDNHYEGTGFECERTCDTNRDCDIGQKCDNKKCVCILEYFYPLEDECIDIDECNGTHGCHLKAICINEVGGYSCSCRNGYVGDGNTCKAVPQTCQDILDENGNARSGDYDIDPDKEGPLNITKVYCEMRPGYAITTFKNLYVPWYRKVTRTFPQFFVKYSSSVEAIRAVAEISTMCYQFVQFKGRGGAAMYQKNGPHMNHWVNGLGKPQYTWGGSSLNGTCACGYNGICNEPSAPCYCDGSSTRACNDNGKITNISALPVTELDISPNKGYGYVHVGPVKCAKQTFDVLESCHAYKTSRYNKIRYDGPQLIAPYGADGKQTQPFLVYCDMTSYPHVGITKITVKNSVANVTSAGVVDLDYTASETQIRRVIDNSAFCVQDIGYDCKNSGLLRNGGRKVYWSSMGGVARNYWGGGKGKENMCGCGIVGNCAHEDNGCNCDLHDGNEYRDFGVLDIKDHLPVGSVTIDEFNPGSSGLYTVGHLRCSEHEFGYATTCQDVLEETEERIHGWGDSGAYWVDPDGPINPRWPNAPNVQPFPVYCDIKDGVATVVVYHNQMKKHVVNGNYYYQFTYKEVTVSQLDALIHRSIYCHQTFDYSCQNSPLHDDTAPLVTWQTRDIRTLSYFGGSGDISGCECALNDTCAQGHVCNCDVGDDKWRHDFNILTNKEDLPMMLLEGVSSNAEIGVGALMCRELYPNCGLRKTAKRLFSQFPTKNGHTYIQPPGVEPFQVECAGTRTILKVIILEFSTAITTTIGISKCYDIEYQGNGTTVTAVQVQALVQSSSNCGQLLSQSCFNAAVTAHSNFTTCDGVAQPGWSGSRGEPMCACGLTGTCAAGPDRLCNCDNDNNEWYKDGTWMLDSNRLAVCQVCVKLDSVDELISVYPNPTRKVTPFLSDLICDIGKINGPKTCQELRDQRETESGNYMMQITANSAPYPIYCIMIHTPPIGITVVKPKNPVIISTTGEAIDITIEYYVYSTEVLTTIVAQARYCTQTIYVNCVESTVEYGGVYGWYSHNGQVQHSWGGNYEDTTGCAGGQCNCNKGGTQTDGGMIVETSLLPISRIKLPVDPNGGYRNVTVGDLKCYNLYRNCEDIRKNRKKTNPLWNHVYAVAPVQGTPMHADIGHFAVKCDWWAIRSRGVDVMELENAIPVVVPANHQFTYKYANYKQINALASISNFCFQSLNFMCTQVPLVLANYAHGHVVTFDSDETTNVAVPLDSNVDGCACTVLGTCPPNSKCNCDGKGYFKTDYGLLTNKSSIPLVKVYHDGGPGWASYSTGHVKCGPKPFGSPKTCAHARRMNFLKSGVILIQPNDAVDPFLVYCDMDRIPNNGVTMSFPKITEGREVTFGSNMVVEYKATSKQQLYQLIRESEFCKQPVKIECRFMEFLREEKAHWLGSVSDVRRTFLGAGDMFKRECNCGVQGYCGGSEDGDVLWNLKRTCNCDAHDNVTRYDAGVIKEKTALPITDFMFEDTDAAYGHWIVGPLYCADVDFDLNECALGFYDCDPNAKCINTWESYECHCQRGWNGKGVENVWSNGRICHDDDECALHKCPDSAICTNTPGDYDCTCKDGYNQIHKHHCQDIDECALGTDECDDNAHCINVPGSYICRCKKNYRGGGRSCEPVGTCSCFGDPHCVTPDGKLVNYQGLCQYVMTRDNCDNLDQPATFEVFTTFAIKDGVRTYGPASWVKQVTVKIYGQTILLMQEREVRVDGVTLNLPSTINDVISVRQFGRYVTVYTSMGIEIKWDGDESVHVLTPGQWRNKTCGLCGNYNNDPDDDMKVGPACVDNQGQLTDNHDLFGESWVTRDIVEEVPTCAANCSKNETEELCKGIQYEKAKDSCDILYNSIYGKFKDCLSQLDPHDADILQFSCIYDICRIDGDPMTGICKHAEALEDACRSSNIEPSNFRDGELCTIACGENQQYKPCVYEEQTTCVDVIRNTTVTTHIECQSGCYCKSGFVMDADEKCIKVDDCGCMFNGKYYKLEEEVPLTNCSEVAICTTGNTMINQSLTCHENATCKLKDGRYKCHCDDKLYGDGVDDCFEDKCLPVVGQEPVCGENETCYRDPTQPDGYECRCSKGFLGDCNNCTEINECETYENLCPYRSDCINTVGSYRCECKKGYSILDGKCNDDNECKLAAKAGTPICGNNSRCMNKMGSHECVCCDGYEDDGNGNCVELPSGTPTGNNTVKCCVCEMDVCNRQGKVCGKDFVEYDSVRDLIISNCENNRTLTWELTVDYLGPCKKVGNCNGVPCPKHQHCYIDQERNLPTCECDSCTEEENKYEKICTSELDVYLSRCMFKQIQCMLNAEADILPNFEPCEGIGGGGGSPVTEWGQWGPCDVECGKGNSNRTRRAYKPPLTGPLVSKYPLTQSTECYEEPCQGSSCVDYKCSAVFAKCVEDANKDPVCECPACTNIGNEPVCGFGQLPNGDFKTRMHKSACHLKQYACQQNYLDGGVINEGHCGLLTINCTRMPEFAQFVRGGDNDMFKSDVKVVNYGCVGGCGTIKEDCCQPKDIAKETVLLFKTGKRSEMIQKEVEVIKTCECVRLAEASTPTTVPETTTQPPP